MSKTLTTKTATLPLNQTVLYRYMSSWYRGTIVGVDKETGTYQVHMGENVIAKLPRKDLHPVSS